MEFVATVQHGDKCRWWDDEEFCDCGAFEEKRLNAALNVSQEQNRMLNEELTRLRAKVERLERERDKARKANLKHCGALVFSEARAEEAERQRDILKSAIEEIGCCTDHGDQDPCEICRIVDQALADIGNPTSAPCPEAFEEKATTKDALFSGQCEHGVAIGQVCNWCRQKDKWTLFKEDPMILPILTEAHKERKA